MESNDEVKRLRKALRSVLTSDTHDAAKAIAREQIERHADGDIQPEVESNEKRIVSEIWETFYGQNLQVANWHKNGDLEPMDNFFESNAWRHDDDGPQSDRDEIKAELIRMRQYVMRKGLGIGECVAWCKIKERFCVGIRDADDEQWLKNYESRKSA